MDSLLQGQCSSVFMIIEGQILFSFLSLSLSEVQKLIIVFCLFAKLKSFIGLGRLCQAQFQLASSAKLSFASHTTQDSSDVA